MFHPNEHGMPYQENLLVKHNDIPEEEAMEDNKVKLLPTFMLTAKSEHDAFGLSEMLLSHVKEDAPKEVLQFLNAIKKVCSEFAEHYGGKALARALLEWSLVVLKKNETKSSSNSMAYCILHIAYNKCYKARESLSWPLEVAEQWRAMETFIINHFHSLWKHYNRFSRKSWA